MDPTLEGDQSASTQGDALILQSTMTIDPNGANQNAAVQQIASNLDWLVTMLKANQTPSNVADMADNSPLSTADLVKILEIALAEIRANQNFAFSVLGFAAIAGSIIQRTHFGGSSHTDISPVLWFVATLLCVVAAAWTACSKQSLRPLGAFVRASGPGEMQLVLAELRTALYRANTAVRKARMPKILVAVGITVLLSALTIEFWSCWTNAKNSSEDKPKAEQQMKEG